MRKGQPAAAAAVQQNLGGITLSSTTTTTTASQSQRFPSTVKKPSSKSTQNLNGNSSSGSSEHRNRQDVLGKYRALGPKIHAFGNNPPATTSAALSEQALYDNYLIQKQQHLQQQISQKQQQVTSPPTQLKSQKDPQQQQQQQQQQRRQNGHHAEGMVLEKRHQQQLNRHIQKKPSLSSLGSPIHNNNVSNRSSGWGGHGTNSTQEIHDNLQEATAAERQTPSQTSPSAAQAQSRVASKFQQQNTILQEQEQFAGANNVESDYVEQGNDDFYGNSQEGVSREEEIDGGVSEKEANDNIATLRSQLRTIFHFYTTFGDRQNISYLKSNKFYKMMLDAGVVSQTLNATRIDLLFCQANKHQANMLFETFLDSLSKIAVLKYPESSVQDAMLLLITNQMNPLYLNIMEKTDLGIELQSFSLPLEIDCIEILTPLYPVLQKIYESYFPWEPQTSMTGEKTYAKSLKSLFVFLNEYQICPAHFSKSTAFLLYNYLVELKNLSGLFAVQDDSSTIFGFADYGVTFSFHRFMLYLIRSSLICYDNRANTSKYQCQTHLEKLNLLLERMEVSPGFLNIQKRTHSTNNSHTSLLIPSTLVTQLSMNKSIEWNTPRASQFSGFRSKVNSGNGSIQDQGSFFNSLNGNSRSMSRSSSQLNRKSFLAEKLCASVTCYEIIERNQASLRKVFSSYCSIGEPMNQSTLKSIKLIKLLTDAGIMKKIQSTPTGENRLNSSSISRNSSRSNLLDSQTKKVRESDFLDDNQQEEGSEMNTNRIKSMKRAFLSRIDMDFMVAKLTGSKWIKSFNSEANSGYNSRVASPSLGIRSHLFKNDSTIGAKGKIEFEHFLKLLEKIAEKLYPELDLVTSLTLIIEEQILKINPNTASTSKVPARKSIQDYLMIIMETFKDPEIVSLLGDAHAGLVMYYKIYQDLKGYMNIKNFMKFFQDFDIFPNMISKAKLSTIFYALASITATANEQQIANEQILRNSSYTSNGENRSRLSNENSLLSSQMSVDQTESEFIDQHLFVEAIFLMALEIYGDQPSNQFKIIMMLEKMNNSLGPVKIQKKLGHTRSTDGNHWDILHTIRKKYPDFYRQGASSRSLSSRNLSNNSFQLGGNFQEIMRQSLVRNVNESHNQSIENSKKESLSIEQQRQSYYGSGAEQAGNYPREYNPNNVGEAGSNEAQNNAHSQVGMTQSFGQGNINQMDGVTAGNPNNEMMFKQQQQQQNGLNEHIQNPRFFGNQNRN